MRIKKAIIGGAATALIATAGAIALPATPALAAYPIPTVYCLYRVTQDQVRERDDPNLTAHIVRVFNTNDVIGAGRDGTVVNAGHLWRRVGDGYGSDHHGGFVANDFLQLVSNTCMS